MVDLGRPGVWQWRRTVAPADAAGCRVYEEQFLRMMSIYGRITGKMLEFSLQAALLWQSDRLSLLRHAVKRRRLKPELQLGVYCARAIFSRGTNR
jgi:hypothetical protein